MKNGKNMWKKLTAFLICVFMAAEMFCPPVLNVMQTNVYASDRDFVSDGKNVVELPSEQSLQESKMENDPCGDRTQGGRKGAYL